MSLKYEPPPLTAASPLEGLVTCCLLLLASRDPASFESAYFLARLLEGVQGYLAHKKAPPPRTLQ